MSTTLYLITRGDAYYQQAVKIHEAEPDLSVGEALQASREYKANRQAGLDPDEARKRIT